ncbi:hypothetical protein FQR65_LT14765 [Abscondita terminalis]|nr:hypothetical protein FQR65_LT14765 [Abscondita terminalis]
MAAAFLPVLPVHNEIVDFSPTLDVGEWVVLMKRPLESATGSGLLAPFTIDVWIIILATLLFIAPVVSLFIVLHKRLCPGEQDLTHSLHACMWFVYGALVKQGSVMFPTADSTRLIFATWWIFITILTAFYTANLTAFLTLSVFTLPVTKPSDIGRQRYSWVTDKGNIINEEEKFILEPVLKGSFATYVNENREQILQKYVKNNNLLYLEEKLIVEHLMYQDYLNKTRENVTETERCVFVITTWTVLQRERAFAYRPNFLFKPLFDNILGHLVESGVVKYKLREHLPKASICPLNLKSIERQLRNTDFLLTYYVVTTGFVLSVLAFILEILIGGKHKRSIQERKVLSEKAFVPRTQGLPPPYHTLFGAPFNYADGDKTNFNGRDYWVVPSERGSKSLVPVRAPSALLFQYTH